MSLLVVVVVALAGGLAALLLRPSRPLEARVLGLVTAVASLVAARLLHDTDAVVVGGAILASSHLVRSIALAWSAGVVVLGCLDLLLAGSGFVTGPSLIGLAVAIAALAAPDAGVAFAALAAGGVVAVLVPSLADWIGPADAIEQAKAARHGAWAALAATIGSIGLVAWSASAVGPLGHGDPLAAADPERVIVLGIALLAMVAIVIFRSALIPAHLWAARFVAGVPAIAIPAALCWGAAAFTLVALGWSQAALGVPSGSFEPGVIVVVAASSIVLGGVAAILHDDFEHILGYSIIQDGGIALLAFATLRPDTIEAAQTWLVASAALKTGLAAWIVVMRYTFGVHKVSELAGWARRAPVLALTLAVVALGVIGLPAMAAFAARGTLIFEALPRALAWLVLVTALTPIVYLGRILVIGLTGSSPAVRDAPEPWPRWDRRRITAWSGRSALVMVRTALAALRANRAPLAAMLSLLAAVIGLVVSIRGVVAA